MQGNNFNDKKKKINKKTIVLISVVSNFVKFQKNKMSRCKCL